jgi:hypothetical protein
MWSLNPQRDKLRAMHPSSCFSESYAEARARFLDAVNAAGLPVQSHAHPLPGVSGEPLAMDVARDGPADAANLLIISSGCHGVEGYCGSGAQIALLQDDDWRAQVRDAGVAVLYIHALNPWGFSWSARATHENIDLNRNFQDFSKALPANPGYDKLAALLVPQTWPPTLGNQLALLLFVARHGVKAVQAAVSGGQYSHPDGLFYGGRAASWSQQILRAVLREQAGRCSRLAGIDLHSGLGKSGVGERIFAGRNQTEALARAQAWWGNVTATEDGNSVSAVTSGNLSNVFYEECAQAEYTGIVMEFGTAPLRQVLDALRAEQWLRSHPDASEQQHKRIRHQTRDAFYADSNEWKQQVVEQTGEAARRALRGLCGDSSV